MKKLFFALALACTLQVAYAQKPDADMQKAVDKALAAAQDAKKATKPATWLALGKAYWAAYQNPLTNVASGVDRTTFSMMFKERPVATETIEVDGHSYEKLVFSRINAYFNAAGILSFTEITRPSVPGDLLGEAAKAYSKAFELGAKDKDVDPNLKAIGEAYYNDALAAYSLGDLKKASALFKGAADASVLPGSSERNDVAIYNTAFTAMSVGEYDLAEEYFNKCLANDYTSEGGVYASLSKVALAKGDTLAAKNHLVTGLTAYPDNGNILAELINLYINTNEDPAKIVELLDEAKRKMPDNASLYYVEGNIYMQINDHEKALAAYKKSVEVNPNFDWGYYGEGLLWVNKQGILAQEANDLPVNAYKEYDAKVEEIGKCLRNAAVAFENAYEKTAAEDLKAACASYLKQVYFALRNESPEYKEAYEKWNAIVNAE